MMNYKTLLLPILFMTTGMLTAQTKYSVQFPDSAVTVPFANTDVLNISELSQPFFKFKPIVLPKNGINTGLTLRLYTQPNIGTSSFSQQVYVMQGPSDWTISNTSKIGDKTLAWASPGGIKAAADKIVRSTTQLNFALKPMGDSTSYLGKFSKGRAYLSLALRSPTPIYSSFFYPANSKIADVNKKPKLVITYNILHAPFRNDWAQLFSTPQHNSYYGWKTNNETTQAVLTSLHRDIYTDISPNGALTLYNNNPIIFTEAESGTGRKFRVKQLDSKGNVIWDQGMDAGPAFLPLIDEKGLMYYFTSSTLTILNLAEQGKILLDSQPLSNYISDGQLLRFPATMGYDGTIYLNTQQGITALTAYPKLQVRWVYKAAENETIGPLSLSADESNAFFIAAGSTSSSLMMLSNVDGELIDKSKPWNVTYRRDEQNYLIPAPVITNTDQVLVLGGFDNGKKLFTYSFDKKLNKPDSIEVSGNDNGISQPVANTDGDVFFILDGKLTGRTNNNQVFKADNDKFDRASILIADGSSHLYVFDPYLHKVACFTYKNQLFSKQFDSDLASAGNLRKHVILSPEAILYTVTGDDLKAILPQVVNQDEVVITGNLSNHTLYRANSRIALKDAALPSTTNVIISSRGEIAVPFGSEFKVQSGATLTIKTAN